MKIPYDQSKYCGGWLPVNRAGVVEWVNRLISELHANKARQANTLARTEFVHNEVAEFRDEVMRTPRLRLLAEQMIEQGFAYDATDPTGKPEIHNLETMFLLIDIIVGKAPEYMQPDSAGRGLIGFPLNAVLDWCMGTQAGYAFFLDPTVNEHLEKILNVWCCFLDSPKSAYVLNDSECGWLCKAAKAELALDDFQCDPAKEHYGFSNWNEFFTRKFKEGKRPVASPEDPYIIVNACESAPYRITANVQTNTKFWLKGQPYSIEYMLDHSKYTNRFLGGTVYQAFLSATHYHCWHAPVSGTIKEVRNIKGSYYAEVNSYPYDEAGPNESQAYITHVAARACVIIEADNKDIGLVGFLAVGMSEVSSCCVSVKEGDHVDKGDYIGCFRFGGSTHCLIFEKGVIDTFVAGAIPAPDFNDSVLMQVRSKLAQAKKK